MSADARRMPPRTPLTDSALARQIAYAECWEDEEVSLGALDPGPEDHVLCVASAGDNAIAFALAGAGRVTAVDVSLPQIALTELKLAGASLDYDDYLCLMGLGPSGRASPSSLYRALRDQLSPGTRSFWDTHADLDRGILQLGKAERIASAWRRWCRPLFHGDAAVDRFFSFDELDQQLHFYDTVWNNRRWRAWPKVVLFGPLLRFVAIDPVLVSQVREPMSERVMRRVREVVSQTLLRRNPYWQRALLGRYLNEESTPRYLREQGHAELKEARERITLVHSALESLLSRPIETPYTAISYSNLFEYVETDHQRWLLEHTLPHTKPGTRIISWTFLVDRPRAESLADRIERREEEAAEWLKRDRMLVYTGFNVEIVR